MRTNPQDPLRLVGDSDTLVDSQGPEADDPKFVAKAEDFGPKGAGEFQVGQKVADALAAWAAQRLEGVAVAAGANPQQAAKPVGVQPFDVTAEICRPVKIPRRRFGRRVSPRIAQVFGERGGVESVQAAGHLPALRQRRLTGQGERDFKAGGGFLVRPNCRANDETTAAGNTGLYFSTNGTTTATLTVPATAAANDIIDFGCQPF